MKHPLRLPAWPLALCGLAVGSAATAQTIAGKDASADAETPPGGVLMRAMRDELRRTMRRLRMEQMESPYFVSYRVDEYDETWTMASFGASEGVWRDRGRTLSVEIRVGDADLDNSNFMPSGFSNSPAQRTISLPLDDNYPELRRRLWLTTDSAYKHALETLAKKRAALENRSREEVADFAPAEPATVFEAPVTPPTDAAAMQELAAKLSAVFRDAPDVHRSGVDAQTLRERVYYVNSEGTSFIRPFAAASVESTASTQSEGGHQLHDAEEFHAATWHDLPAFETMAERLNGMAAALAARRGAEFVGRYNGPVLFEGVAAAEMLLQAFVTRLLGGRIPVVGDSNMQNFATSLRAPFADRIGARVLPRFLDLRDDPTLRVLAGNPLRGGYSIDDDGVPSAPTLLVDKGMLRALLTTRSVASDQQASTGNRRGAAALPSNIVLSTDDGLSSDELRAEFLQLVAERGNEFGIVVRRLGTFYDGAGDSIGDQVEQVRLVRAYKVFPDGREEVIRKAELVGLGDATFKEIVASSERANVYAMRFLAPNAWVRERLSVFYGRRSILPVVSVSTPDLLFEELTLRKPIGNVPRPPVAAHPLFDKP